MDIDLKKRSLICGGSNGGKSVLLRYLLKQEKSKFDKVFVISGTESVNGFYSSFIDKENIFTEYSDEWVEKLLNKLQQYKAKNGKCFNCLILFDDLGSNPDFTKSKMLKKLMTMGRHYGCYCVCLIQYIYQLPPVVRTNFSTIFIGQSNRKTLDILTDEFLFGDITKKDFDTMYKNAVKDYGFLIINTNSVKNNSDLDTIYGKIRCPEEYI
jgi:hypothetical protein